LRRDGGPAAAIPDQGYGMNGFESLPSSLGAREAGVSRDGQEGSLARFQALSSFETAPAEPPLDEDS